MHPFQRVVPQGPVEEGAPARLREAVQGERLVFCVGAPWSGVGGFLTALVALVLLASAIGVALVVTGRDGVNLFALVWAVLFGGLSFLVLASRLRAGWGGRWFAGTPTRLLAYGRLGTVSVPWTDLCEEVTVSGGGARGGVTLRLRGPGASADAVVGAGLARQRMGVSGRDPTVWKHRGHGDQPIHRALELHLAGVRRHHEVARACARLLGRPAASPAVPPATVQGKRLPARLLRALEGASVEAVARGAPRGIEPLGNFALFALTASLSALFGFLWWASLLAFLERPGSVLGWSRDEGMAGTFAFPLFIVPFAFVALVNLREALRRPPWVALGRDGVRVVEGRRVRWLSWARVEGDPTVTWDGLVRLPLARADHHPDAHLLGGETIQMRGAPDPAGLARRAQDLLEDAREAARRAPA